MAVKHKKQNYFIRHIALPQDHGSWVFLLSPLLIGFFAADRWSPASLYLIIAALAAFLLRQPLVIATKAYSGRRSRRDLPAARFWIIVYAVIGLLALTGLITQGYNYLLLLLIPGLPVFAWHLYLVSRRAERRKIGIEVVGSGVLALTAPAAYWVGVGQPEPTGWLLFALTWLQSAASIVYAYLRLAQREFKELPTLKVRFQLGQRAIIYTSFNLVLTVVLSLTAVVPTFLPLPYAVQWGETIWGVLNPAVRVKPTKIGVRQLIISSLFTILFILTWRF